MMCNSLGRVYLEKYRTKIIQQYVTRHYHQISHYQLLKIKMPHSYKVFPHVAFYYSGFILWRPSRASQITRHNYNHMYRNQLFTMPRRPSISPWSATTWSCANTQDSKEMLLAQFKIAWICQQEGLRGCGKENVFK